MALAVYTKTCAKNVGGNLQRVYLSEIANIASVTGTTELTAVTMESGKYFQMAVAEIDSVQFKSEGQGASNYFDAQTLTMKFANRTKALDVFIESITDNIACGIVAIRVDGNGLAWMSGYDAAAVDKKSRPYNKCKISYDSGLKPSDEGGNQVTVELMRESENDEIPFNTALSTALAIMDNSTAAFIAIT